MKELRYMSKASYEMADNCKFEIVEVLLSESDMSMLMSDLCDQVGYSDRSIRKHIKESDLMEREGESYGRESLVYVVDDMAKKSLKVSHSCIKANEKNGLPGDKV